MKDSFLGWFVGLVMSEQEIFSCLGCFSIPGAHRIFFFSQNTISLHLSPSPSKLGGGGGRQSYRVAFLLIRGNLPHMFSEVEHLESRLNQYDDLLEHIR